jgi:hypothetical protein
MNGAFTGLLDSRRQAIRADLAASARRATVGSAVFGAAGLAAAVALLPVSVALARLLAGSLEGQLDALATLGQEAGASIDRARGRDEVANLASAIEAFRGALLTLRQRERALSDLNEALARARDQLELRVEERTHLLTQFPIHHIKLGRSFVQRIGRDEAGESLIRALLHLTQRLKINVVAIGVEDGLQRSFLSSAGCRLLQGFQVAEPLPGEQVLGWLAAHAAPALPRSARRLPLPRRRGGPRRR